MDIRAYNRAAWNRQVESADVWTVPVSSEVIERARRGDWSIVLTPVKAVPRSWFPALGGTRVLGLAASGGQQGPVLAAAGAHVTVLDNSPAQLAQDRRVAERDGLELELVEGDMADLSAFADETFDVIVHPCSNCFVPDVRRVWREAYRVLRPGGVIMAGFVNPVAYLFDEGAQRRGQLVVRHRVPYSDVTDLSDDERQARIDAGEPLSFGHTLEDQLGGQLDAGLVIDRMFEDGWPKDSTDPLNPYIQQFMATRALRPVTAGRSGQP